MNIGNNYARHSSPFCVSYWRDAAAEFRNTRRLLIAALLTALCIVIEKFNIPVTPTLQISFSYIAVSLCSFLTGPLVAIPCGIIADVVGAIGSGYSFFFGYTLSAVLGAFIYAIFLYRQKTTFTRIILARVTVNLFVNIIIGSVWRQVMSGGPYFYYVAVAGIKNLLMLPLEAFIMLVLFKSMAKPLRELKLVPPDYVVTVEKKKVILLAVIIAICTVFLLLYLVNRTVINDSIKSIFA